MPKSPGLPLALRPQKHKTDLFFTTSFLDKMAVIRRLAHQFLPDFVKQFLQNRNKEKRRKKLAQQAETGGLTESKIIEQLKEIGIQPGSTLLVHASLSKMGYVEGGAKTVVNALISSVGPNGHLLMPTSSNKSWQLEFIQSDPIFDVRNTPSAMGAITEIFRTSAGVLRSIHPTESVACLGPKAQSFVAGHFGALTPYLPSSPFGQVIENEGLILMIGVTLDNAGTNVHCLEDAVDFPFPVYHEEIFKARVIDYNGQLHQVETKVHNPVFSKKRYCDYFIPILEENGSLKHFQLGDAPCLLIKAKEMFETLKEQLEMGYTIYGKTK